MRSESLRDRITLQQRSGGQNGTGEVIEDWADVATVWANIRHPSGAEVNRADAPVSVVKASIRIRYRSGCVAGMRVQHKSTYYSILAVLPDEVQKDYVDLVCQVVR